MYTILQYLIYAIIQYQSQETYQYNASIAACHSITRVDMCNHHLG